LYFLFKQIYKILKKLFIINTLLILIISCGENTLIKESGKPQIDFVLPSEFAIGDTIEIYGTNFGDPSQYSFLVFGDTLKIPASKCLWWTISKIRVIVPKISTNKLYIIVDKDTSNVVKIKINIVPKIDTVEVPSGTFIMGSRDGLPDEQPEHEVVITSNLIVSKYEVNQRLFYQVMGYNPSLFKDYRLPVDSIEWSVALDFCNKLSEIYGLKPVYTFTGNNATWDTTANGWRLPTEAEWEYLCRAGSNSDYSGSNVVDHLGWYNQNSGLMPHPVGTKQPNAFGLYDLHGNVWEWCWDWYASNYYKNSPQINPKGPIEGSRRVARGGSYFDGNSFARSSNRFYLPEFLKQTGFRIVRNKQ